MQIESGVGINADWYWEAQNILEGRKGTRARTEAGQVGMRRRPADLQAKVDEMHQETYMDTHIECGGDEDVAGAGVGVGVAFADLDAEVAWRLAAKQAGEGGAGT
jgi:hypothetical protein